MTDTTRGDGARSGSTAQPVGGAKGPDELRQQIEQTRSQLGDTVEELAGKADVKGRARARAADLRDKAGAMTVQLRSSVAQAGHGVQDRAGRAGHAVQEKAGRAGHTVQEKAGGAGQAARRRPGPVLVAGAVAGVLVAVGVVLRRRSHGYC
jgi:hypothetical protein